jgi:hypothetical protein
MWIAVCAIEDSAKEGASPMNTLRKITFIIFALLLPTSVGAQTKISLHVSVSADDVIKAQIKSLISREFRSMADIDVVGDEELHAGTINYRVRVVVLRDRTTSGRDMGFSMAYVLENGRWSESLIERAFGAESKADKVSLAKSLNLSRIVAFAIFAGPDLPDLCKTVVAAVDTNESFEETRRAYKKFDEASRKTVQ